MSKTKKDKEIQDYLNSPEYLKKKSEIIQSVDNQFLRVITEKYIDTHCLNYSEKEKTIVRNAIHIGYNIKSINNKSL